MAIQGTGPSDDSRRPEGVLRGSRHGGRSSRITGWRAMPRVLTTRSSPRVVVGLAMMLLVPLWGCGPGPHVRGRGPAVPLAVASGPVHETHVDVRRLEEAIVSVAEQVSPCVVSMSVQTVRQAPANPLPWPFGGRPDRQPGIATGMGSGVIVRADGYILTNLHVVRDANRIEVQLGDGRRFLARVIGTDPATDLAVVRIEASDLPVAEMATADSVRVGQWVVAIGAPFGLRHTVTAGVISAVGRGSIGANEIEDYVQTDASINPGNSGGPLVNLDGRVVGINTMIAGPGTGIGFAVPAEIARDVVDQIALHGVVRRAWIGVGYQELTPELASHFGVDPGHGALVSSVVESGPAAAAGLRPGDVILSIDGEALGEGRDLLRVVLRRPVGASLRMGVRRGGEELELAVTTIERPGQVVAPPTGSPPRGGGDTFGLQLQALTPLLRQQARVAAPSGAFVHAVAPGSPAERAGLRPGDVIVEADREAVDGPSKVQAALADGAALLRVLRGEGAFYAVVQRDAASPAPPPAP